VSFRKDLVGVREEQAEFPMSVRRLAVMEASQNIQRRGCASKRLKSWRLPHHTKHKRSTRRRSSKIIGEHPAYSIEWERSAIGTVESFAAQPLGEYQKGPGASQMGRDLLNEPTQSLTNSKMANKFDHGQTQSLMVQCRSLNAHVHFFAK
jgi:hypothetical protein